MTQMYKIPMPDYDLLGQSLIGQSDYLNLCISRRFKHDDWYAGIPKGYSVMRNGDGIGYGSRMGDALGNGFSDQP